MLEQQCGELEEMIPQQGLGGAPQVVLAMMGSRRALSYQLPWTKNPGESLAETQQLAGGRWRRVLLPCGSQAPARQALC